MQSDPARAACCHKLSEYYTMLFDVPHENVCTSQKQSKARHETGNASHVSITWKMLLCPRVLSGWFSTFVCLWGFFWLGSVLFSMVSRAGISRPGCTEGWDGSCHSLILQGLHNRSKVAPGLPRLTPIVRVSARVL